MPMHSLKAALKLQKCIVISYWPCNAKQKEKGRKYIQRKQNTELSWGNSIFIWKSGAVLKVGQAASSVAAKKEGIGRDNCNLLSKEYIAVNFSSTKGSQHLFSFIHKCVAHSFLYVCTYVHMLRSSQYATQNMKYACPFLHVYITWRNMIY